MGVSNKRVVIRDANAWDGPAQPLLSCDDADADADVKVTAAKVSAVISARARGVPDPTFTVQVGAPGSVAGDTR